MWRPITSSFRPAHLRPACARPATALATRFVRHAPQPDQSLSRGRIPDDERAVGARRGKRPAIARHRDRRDHARVFFQTLDDPALGDVPNQESALCRSGQQMFPIGGEGGGAESAGKPGDIRADGEGRKIPHLELVAGILVPSGCPPLQGGSRPARTPRRASPPKPAELTPKKAHRLHVSVFQSR